MFGSSISIVTRLPLTLSVVDADIKIARVESVEQNQAYSKGAPRTRIRAAERCAATRRYHIAPSQVASRAIRTSRGGTQPN